MPLDQPEEPKGTEMSFLDHLEALRWHITRSILAILLFGIASFIFIEPLMKGIVLAPLDIRFPTYRFFCLLSQSWLQDDSLCINAIKMELINYSMAGQFITHLSIAFVSGLVLAFPYIAWEIWRFIKPALYEQELRYARGMVGYFSLLFFLGVLFGYFVIAPLSVSFFGNYRIVDDVQNMIQLSSYMSMVTSTVLGCGIVFELPIVIYFLAKVGLVTSVWLKNQRRIMYVIILILSAIITPPDVTSQIIVSIPLFVLYEVGINIARRIEKQAKT